MVVGHGGVGMRRGERGWELFESDSTANFTAVYSDGIDELWIGDDNSTISHWDGSGWTSYETSRSFVLDFWGVSERLWAVIDGNMGGGVWEFMGQLNRARR